MVASFLEQKRCPLALCVLLMDKKGIINIPFFEFDDSKSESNLKKHGIDFVAARALWDDSELLEIPARTIDEPRFLNIGRIESDHWTAVVTYRNERIRIISVRRSRQEEVELYESEDL